MQKTITIRLPQLSLTHVLMGLVILYLGYRDFSGRRAAPAPNPAPPVVVNDHAAVKSAARAWQRALPAAYRAAASQVRSGGASAADPKVFGKTITGELHASGKVLGDATLADPDLAGALEATAAALEAK